MQCFSAIGNEYTNGYKLVFFCGWKRNRNCFFTQTLSVWLCCLSHSKDSSLIYHARLLRTHQGSPEWSHKYTPLLHDEIVLPITTAFAAYHWRLLPYQASFAACRLFRTIDDVCPVDVWYPAFSWTLVFDATLIEGTRMPVGVPRLW